jgi:methionine synthase I (cobalamin-dependent)
MSFNPSYLATAIGSMPHTNTEDACKTILQNIPLMIENGANLIGGCCGTNPDYIGDGDG